MGLYVNQLTSAGEDSFDAIAYYRLSKDDGTSHESDSIANQRVLIREYVKSHPNIRLVDEAFDDGYTGTNFDRPGFQKVMDVPQNVWKALLPNPTNGFNFSRNIKVFLRLTGR